MAGPLDVAYANADQSVRDPLVAIPRTPGERFEAEFSSSMAPDRYFRQGSERFSLWQDALDAYEKTTGEKLQNPYGYIYARPVVPQWIFGLLGGPTGGPSEAQLKNDAIQKFRMARESFPDLPDPELIDFRVAQEARYRRDEASRRVDTGNGLSAFAGGVVGESLTPHGIAGMLVPPARMALLPADGVMRGFLGSVGREALTQAAVGAGTQAMGEALDLAARSQLGTEQTPSEAIQNVLGAAVGGALLGGGFRGLHEAWRRLAPAVRETAPTAVRDAAAAIERSILDEGTNPLPPEASALHERILDRAQQFVLRGRGADVNLPGLLPEIDTPMTAVGRFLTPAPMEPFRLPPGLAPAIRALPDADIEALARQFRPKSFVHVDRVDGDLSAVRTRLEEIEANRRGIAYSDIVDQDTGFRLADIEARLEQRALPAREKARLEDERTMIMESVDRDGRLAQRLEQARDTVLTDAEKAERADLEAKKADLERERVIAEQDARSAAQWTREQLDKVGERARIGADTSGLDVDLPALATAANDAAQQAILRNIPDVTPSVARRARPVPADQPIPSKAELDAMFKAAEPAKLDPAMEAQVAQMLEADPERTILVSTDGENVRSVKIKDLLEEAKAQEKEAQVIQSCAMGAI